MCSRDPVARARAAANGHIPWREHGLSILLGGLRALQDSVATRAEMASDRYLIHGCMHSD